MAEIVRDATIERAINVKRKGRTRDSELSKHAEKWKEAKTHATEMAGLGLDAAGEHEMYRRMVVGTALDFMEVEASRADHPDEVNDWSKHVIRKRFSGVESVVEIKASIDENEYPSASIERSYDRLAKSVKLLLNKKGLTDKELSKMDGDEIDAKLFENLKGIGEKVKEFLISDDGLITALKDVEGVMEDNGYVLDPKLGKGTRLRFINGSITETERILKEEGVREKNWGLVRQCDLTIEYLTLLKSEVEGVKLPSTSEDCFIDFIGKHVLLDGLLHVSDDGSVDVNSVVFEVEKDVDGITAKIDPDTGEKIYKNPEQAKLIKQVETNMQDLLMIVSGGEFDNIKDINGLLYDNAQVLLSDYVRKREGGKLGVGGLDLPNGRKSWLRDIKHTVGGYVCKAILESGDKVNRDVLGTLHAQKVDRLLPAAADGLGVDVIVNLSSNETVQKVLRQICNIDMDGIFIRMENQDGFSSYETKQALKNQIEEMAESLTKNNDMYENGTDEYREEINRLVDWLNVRSKIYEKLMKEDWSRVGGRYGEMIPIKKGEKYFRERLRMAEELLDEVKSSDAPPGSLSIMEQCGKLFAFMMSEYIEPEIKSEISARMHLYFMGYHMSAAGGSIGERGSINEAYLQGLKEKMLLTPEDLEYFLSGELPSGESFNIIEWVNHGNNYFRTTAEIMGIDVPILKYWIKNEKTGKIEWSTDEYDHIHMKGSVDNGAFMPLKVDNEAGKLLIKLKESGMGFLGLSGKISDADYLKAWTDRKRFEFLSVFMTEKSVTMNEIQSPTSFFWGKRARANSGEDPVSYNLQLDSNGERKNMVRDFFLDIVKNMNDPKGKVNTKLDVVSFVEKGMDRSKVKMRTGKHDMEVGWETAETLLVAQGEDCLFCPIIRAGDDYAEKVVLAEAGQAYRLKKMKVSGTNSVQSEFVSYGRTRLRANSFEYVTDGGGVRRIRKGPFTILTVDEINYDSMRELNNGEAYGILALLQNKIMPVSEILLKKAISPKDITTAEFFHKLYDPATKMADYGQYIFCEPVVEGGQITKYRPIEINDSNAKDVADRIRNSIYEHLVYCTTQLSNRFTEADNFMLSTAATIEHVVEQKLVTEGDGKNKVKAFVSRKFADMLDERGDVVDGRLFVQQMLKEEDMLKKDFMGEAIAGAIKQTLGGGK